MESTTPTASPFRLALAGMAGLAVMAATPAEARSCKRMSKTAGAVVGAVGGGLLGNVIVGGTTATVLGAAAGGIAGHEIAKNGRKKCRYVRR